MKILVAVLVTVVILGGGVTATVMKYRTGGKVESTDVRVEPVARGDLVEIVSAPGQVQPRTKVQISARVAARIRDLPFDEGAKVTKDALLVKLDATELEAQLRATKARAAGQKAQLEESTARVHAQMAQIEASRIMHLDAQRDAKRQRQLVQDGDIAVSIAEAAEAKAGNLEQQLESSVRQLEADRLNLKVLKHNIDAAEAEILRATDNLAYTTITSPIDGIITRLNAKAGEMVVTGTMNNPGTVIMEVSDLSEMQVDAQVDESNIDAVKEGQKAKVRITAYQDETFDGVVKLVGLDTAELQRSGGGGGGGGGQMQGKWYRARIVLDTKGRRIPAGLSADVDIETKVHTSVVKVPTQAVMGRPLDDIPAGLKDRPEVDKNKTLVTVVFRVDNGKAVMTPVAISAGDMTHTVIDSGLNVGDRIITGPYKVLPGLKDAQDVKEEAATTQPATKPRAQPTTAEADS
ncbi:MAG: efflux RND transporter periplasmic adaptor subunit [Tepidisphaeraceae bacterium]